MGRGTIDGTRWNKAEERREKGDLISGPKDRILNGWIKDHYRIDVDFSRCKGVFKKRRWKIEGYFSSEVKLHFFVGRKKRSSDEKKKAPKSAAPRPEFYCKVGAT